MRKHLLIYLLLIVLSRSCYYSDLSTYEMDISTDYSPDIRVSSNLSSYDSVQINDSLLFIYEIAIDTGFLYYANLYIGNVVVYSSAELKDSVWLAPPIETDGDYTLTQISYFKSYSGSLGDKLNAEFIPYDTAWTIKFYHGSLK